MLFKTTEPGRFMGAFGWSLDPKDKKRMTYVRGKDEKVKFWQPANGLWHWKNFESGAAGTIIDIAKDHVGGNFGQARLALRNILGNAPVPVPVAETSQNKPELSLPYQSEKTRPITSFKKSSEEVLREYATGADIWYEGDAVPTYLLSRGITAISPAFSGKFSVSINGNLRFPHHYLDDEGFKTGGIEKRGPGIKGLYTEDGTNGVWVSDVPSCRSGVAVVFETQLDAMSYDILHPRSDGHILLSLRAGTEKLCAEILKFLRTKGIIHTVILATDNDHAGATYAGKVMTELHYGRNKETSEKFFGGLRAWYQPPDDGEEDWNDVLMARAGIKSGRRWIETE